MYVHRLLSVTVGGRHPLPGTSCLASCPSPPWAKWALGPEQTLKSQNSRCQALQQHVLNRSSSTGSHFHGEITPLFWEAAILSWAMLFHSLYPKNEFVLIRMFYNFYRLQVYVCADPLSVKTSDEHCPSIFSLNLFSHQEASFLCFWGSLFSSLCLWITPPEGKVLLFS